MATRREALGDERAFDFDLRLLEPGDTVEIFQEAAQRWRRGCLTRHKSGVASVVLADGSRVPLAVAARMGVRRILN